MSKRPTKKKPPPRKSVSLEAQKNAMEGIEEALYWHTVGVVADSGRTLGTATAIRWKTNTLTVAALVFITECDDLLSCWFSVPV